MKTVAGIFAFATLAALFAGCSSQPVPPPASGSSSAAVKSAPLEEPFPSILTRWNYYRAAAGVLPIVDEPDLNAAALHHAKYLVRNHIEWGDAIIRDGRMLETGWNPSAHYESVGNPWYTADGADWAGATTIIRGSAIPLDGASLVDGQAERL